MAKTHGRRSSGARGASAYALAIAMVAATLLARFVLSPWLGSDLPFLLFLPAVMVSGWYGGPGPGLLALALSTAAALALGYPFNWLSLALFVSIGAGITRLAQHTRTAIELSSARAERLEAVFNTTVDGIIVIDGRGRIEAFNRGAERLFGYEAKDVVGRNVSLLMPSPDHERHDAYLARYLAGGEGSIIGKGRRVTGLRRDGSTFPLHLSVGEMSVDGERRFTGVLHDLTVRAQLEDELRSSEARWRAIVESAVDGIIVIDAKGCIEAFNPAAERLFGYGEGELRGQNVSVLMPAPYRDEHDAYLGRFLATGQARIIGVGREVTGRRRDGSTFPLHLSVGEFTVAETRRFAGIVHDLSARVQLEHKLRDQAALAKLGEMSAVIAHEVKNPLAGIRAAIQMVSYSLPPGGEDRAMVKDILTRIDALDGLTRDLLQFARPPEPKRAETDIRELAELTAHLLRQDPAFEKVDIDVNGPSAPVRADPDMLKIVFQNLLINGAQAMLGKGHLDVRLDADSDSCRISVSDTGPGIPPDVRQRMFDPFFTTKARGSGLGLPTVKRIVDAHGGDISVDCPSSGGTTIGIRLPAQ